MYQNSLIFIWDSDDMMEWIMIFIMLFQYRLGIEAGHRSYWLIECQMAEFMFYYKMTTMFPNEKSWT